MNEFTSRWNYDLVTLITLDAEVCVRPQSIDWNLSTSAVISHVPFRVTLPLSGEIISVKFFDLAGLG